MAFSIIGNISPKDVSFSDFICIFAMLDEVLFDYYSNTKLSESSDMAKESVSKVKIYSVAELRI